MSSQLFFLYHVSGQVAGKILPKCISETVRYRKYILGGEIGDVTFDLASMN